MKQTVNILIGRSYNYTKKKTKAHIHTDTANRSEGTRVGCPSIFPGLTLVVLFCLETEAKQAVTFQWNEFMAYFVSDSGDVKRLFSL